MCLFESYFLERKQYVENRGLKSRLYWASSGVHQGSVLGPLFFSLFINDLCSVLSVQHLLYADDVKLFTCISSEDDCLRLQRDLDIMGEWCFNNYLALNVSKCVVTSYFRIKNPITFSSTIGGQILTRSTVVKDLGVTFNTGLTFVPHFESVASKCHKIVGFIIRR